MGRDLVARIEVAVHPDPWPPGEKQGFHLADGGPEALLRILGVDAHLYGVPPHLHLLLLEPKLLPHGDPELGLNQVNAGDHLGHGVLHLDAGVHLYEVEVPLLIHQELQSARGHVPHVPGKPGGCLGNGLPGFPRQGARGFLQELLVPALDGAVPLPKVDDVLPIPQDLDLNVLRLLDVLLQVDGGVAKGSPGLLLGLLDRPFQLLLGVHQPHAPAPAPGGGLKDHGIADLLGGPFGLLHAGKLIRPRNRGHPGLPGHLPGGGLVPKGPHILRGGTDEGDAVVPAHLGKGGVLRQEAVTGMNGVGPGHDGRGKQVRDVQVALPGRRRSDADGLVRQEHGKALLVGGGVGHHGLDP